MGGLCRATPPFIQKYRLKRESPPLPAPLSSLWANQKLILLEDWESMKMVDGSTVRHGRVDCSYPERVRGAKREACRGGRGGKECGVMGNQGGMGNNAREKGGKGWCRDDGVNFPLVCSNKGEKRRKSTAGRKLSIIFLFIVKLSFIGRWSYATRNRSHSETHCCLKVLRFIMAYLGGWYEW